jgi:septum formation protein
MPPRLPLRLILASQSPRRHELASKAGWDVIVTAPPEQVEADAEPRGLNETISDYVVRLAHAKAAAVASSVTTDSPAKRDRIILACDTLGEIDQIALGKPRDKADAADMIRRLSGRLHRVITGVSLWIPTAPASTLPSPVTGRASTNAPDSYTVLNAVAESLVFMEPISPPALEAYLATNAWRGKAGSCGLQDGLLPLSLASGTADTVVGLPVSLVESLIADHCGNEP